jgi:hypothetical protein
MALTPGAGSASPSRSADGGVRAWLNPFTVAAVQAGTDRFSCRGGSPARPPTASGCGGSGRLHMSC